jgi:hypothetical protein
VGSIALVGEGNDKTAVLKCRCHCGEDKQHGDKTVVIGGKHACQHNAKDSIEYLSGTIVDASPYEPFGGLVF